MSLKQEEKLSLTIGRDGGLQNLEVHGLISLKITDENYGRIKVLTANNDKKGIQLQVMVCINWSVFLSVCSVWYYSQTNVMLAFFNNRRIPTLTKRCSRLHLGSSWKHLQSRSLSIKTLVCWSGVTSHKTRVPFRWQVSMILMPESSIPTNWSSYGIVTLILLLLSHTVCIRTCYSHLLAHRNADRLWCFSWVRTD